jgi:hypothetical protein
MAIEPTKKIYETPLIRREENTIQSQRRKPKQQKKKEDDEDKTAQHKVDIRV